MWTARCFCRFSLGRAFCPAIHPGSRPSGRAGKQGEVVLQTHHPEHPYCKRCSIKATTLLPNRHWLRTHDAAAAVDQPCDCACGRSYNQHAPLFLQQLRNLILSSPWQTTNCGFSARFRLWHLSVVPLALADLVAAPFPRALATHLSGTLALINTIPDSRKVKWVWMSIPSKANAQTLRGGSKNSYSSHFS